MDNAYFSVAFENKITFNKGDLMYNNHMFL